MTDNEDIRELRDKVGKIEVELALLKSIKAKIDRAEWAVYAALIAFVMNFAMNGGFAIGG